MPYRRAHPHYLNIVFLAPVYYAFAHDSLYAARVQAGGIQPVLLNPENIGTDAFGQLETAAKQNYIVNFLGFGL